MKFRAPTLYECVSIAIGLYTLNEMRKARESVDGARKQLSEAPRAAAVDVVNAARKLYG